jgi:hypothetical protein
MADEETTPPAGTDGDAGADDIDAPDPRHERDRRRREQLSADLKTANGKLAERDALDRKAAEEQELKAGEFDKLDSRRKTELRDLQEKLDAANATIQAGETATRRGAFLDALMTSSGASNRSMVALALPQLGLEDSAPENFTERDVRVASKALQKLAPELFGSGGSSEAKPVPGGGKGQSGGKDWRAVGQAYTDRSTNSPYARAKGQTK